ENVEVLPDLLAFYTSGIDAPLALLLEHVASLAPRVPAGIAAGPGDDAEDAVGHAERQLGDHVGFDRLNPSREIAAAGCQEFLSAFRNQIRVSDTRPGRALGLELRTKCGRVSLSSDLQASSGLPDIRPPGYRFEHECVIRHECGHQVVELIECVV